MTKTELRELYGEKCVYCKVDEETEKELSDWELKEIFEPTINKMIADGYTYEQLEEFIILCHSCCFMSDKTYDAIEEKYDDLVLWVCECYFLSEEEYESLFETWENDNYFIEIKKLNK